MDLTLVIFDENGEPLVTHDLELTNKFKLKFMPSGKSIKDILKSIFKKNDGCPRCGGNHYAINHLGEL